MYTHITHACAHTHFVLKHRAHPWGLAVYGGYLVVVHENTEKMKHRLGFFVDFIYEKINQNSSNCRKKKKSLVAHSDDH